jgi:hypothetical protein
MSFSQEFLGQLQRNAEKANITPKKFIELVETYLRNPPKDKMFSNGTIRYDFPPELQQHPDRLARIECLKALKKALEDGHYVATTQTYGIPKTTFAFIREDYSCQYDSTLVACNDNLIDAIALLVNL